MKPCVIYALINPIDKNVFYVGKTTYAIKSRLSGHITEAKRGTKEKDLLIRLILNMGKRPKIKVLETKKYPNYTWKNMAEREKYWVQKMVANGHPLVNKVYAKSICYV